MWPASNINAAWDIASRFCSSLTGRTETIICENIQSLLSAESSQRLQLEIQDREYKTLVFLLKDQKWKPGEQKSGIYDVKFTFQNTEHRLSIEYNSGNELLNIYVDNCSVTKKLPIFCFVNKFAELMGISVNEMLFRMAGFEGKDVINLFRIDQNQEGLNIDGRYIPRTRFDIKVFTEPLWKEYSNRFGKVWISDIDIIEPSAVNGLSDHNIRERCSSDFKNVAVTYILEKYLTARNMKGATDEEILDLGVIFSSEWAHDKFGYFDIPLSYFDGVYLSWPWHGKHSWPMMWGICKDFCGHIVSVEMIVHDELNPYEDKYDITSMTNPFFLKYAIIAPKSFCSRWLKGSINGPEITLRSGYSPR